MRLILVRHGESENNALWDRTGSEEGRVPEPRLTARGREQAAALAAYAVDPGLPWRPTHLYASAMVRAVETAAPLADALDLPLGLQRELFEVGGVHDVGADGVGRVPHRGLGRGDLEAVSPRLTIPAWLADDGWYDGPLEDSRDVVRERAARLVAGLHEEHGPDDVVALVSHGIFINALLVELLGMGSLTGGFAIANTSLTLVEPYGEAEVADVARIARRVGWSPHLEG